MKFNVFPSCQWFLCPMTSTFADIFWSGDSFVPFNIFAVFNCAFNFLIINTWVVGLGFLIQLQRISFDKILLLLIKLRVIFLGVMVGNEEQWQLRVRPTNDNNVMWIRRWLFLTLEYWWPLAVVVVGECCQGWSDVVLRCPPVWKLLLGW